MPKDNRILLNVGDADETRELPSRWEICPECDGNEKSSAYLGAFTGDQMREDPDFATAYRAGEYDRTCAACNGAGKIRVPDFRRMSEEDAAAYRCQCADDADIESIQRAELRAEHGIESGY